MIQFVFSLTRVEYHRSKARVKIRMEKPLEKRGEILVIWPEIVQKSVRGGGKQGLVIEPIYPSD